MRKLEKLVHLLLTKVLGAQLAFTSGLENLHRAEEVDEGDRYVLAMWFTCSEQHQYVEPD